VGRPETYVNSKNKVMEKFGEDLHNKKVEERVRVGRKGGGGAFNKCRSVGSKSGKSRQMREHAWIERSKQGACSFCAQTGTQKPNKVERSHRVDPWWKANISKFRPKRHSWALHHG